MRALLLSTALLLAYGLAEVVAGLVATVLLALVIDALIQGIGWTLTPWTRRGRA